jgi:hypothetical protein
MGGCDEQLLKAMHPSKSAVTISCDELSFGIEILDDLSIVPGDRLSLRQLGLEGRLNRGLPQCQGLGV